MSVNFTFKKKLESKIKVTSTIAEHEIEEKIRCDTITGIIGQKIESTIPDEVKSDLVIPLIENNNWRAVAKRKREELHSQQKIIDVQPNVNSDETIDDKAKRELLDEVNRDNEKWENRGENNSNMIIPMLLRNCVPSGFEEDDNFDVSARADNPTIDDYEKIPVEEFGLAMLRGMGWKPGEAVGGKMKQVIAPLEVSIRPKGMGLGAESAMSKSSKANSKSSTTNVNPEELEFKQGCHVCVEVGNYIGYYGKVETIDDDLVRANVRLILNSETIVVPIATLRVVTRNEFSKEGKVVNKASYDEYKGKESVKKESGVHNNASNGESSKHRSWIQKRLRVRIIDKNYRKGKFYKEKVVINKVYDDHYCVCETDDKIMLDDVRDEMIETVIPRKENAEVIVLQGEHKGRIGYLIERDDQKYSATVRLSKMKDYINFDFDHICEYVYS